MDLEREVGMITFLHRDRLFGFIRSEDKKEIFFHASGVIAPSFEYLREGNEVNFMRCETPKGTRAIGVKVVAM